LFGERYLGIMRANCHRNFLFFMIDKSDQSITLQSLLRLIRDKRCGWCFRARAALLERGAFPLPLRYLSVLFSATPIRARDILAP